MGKIDDPLDASPVHMFCGAWGVISVGLFATKYNVEQAYGTSEDYGIFYGAGPAQLGIQLLGIFCIVSWSMLNSALVFGLLKSMKMLRVPPEDEMLGLDESHHGGAAYDLQPPTKQVEVSTPAAAVSESLERVV